MKFALVLLSSVVASTFATRCVKDCAHVADGDYQSCHGCHVYVTCSNGLTHDDRPCPSDLVWDDHKKRCEWTSETCGGAPRVPAECPDPDGGSDRLPGNIARRWDGKTVLYRCHRGWWCAAGDFIRKCSDGKWSGKKPVCKKCCDPDRGHLPSGVLRRIHDGQAYYKCDKRWRYVSGDRVRSCSWKDGRWSGKPIKCSKCCVDNCHKMKDGDYQSCKGCNVYITCSNGLTYDNRPCPDDLVWDDHKKRCEWKSPTCNY